MKERLERYGNPAYDNGLRVFPDEGEQLFVSAANDSKIEDGKSQLRVVSGEESGMLVKPISEDEFEEAVRIEEERRRSAREIKSEEVIPIDTEVDDFGRSQKVFSGQEIGAEESEDARHETLVKKITEIERQIDAEFDAEFDAGLSNAENRSLRSVGIQSYISQLEREYTIADSEVRRDAISREIRENEKVLSSLLKSKVGVMSARLRYADGVRSTQGHIDAMKDRARIKVYQKIIDDLEKKQQRIDQHEKREEALKRILSERDKVHEDAELYLRGNEVARQRSIAELENSFLKTKDYEVRKKLAHDIWTQRETLKRSFRAKVELESAHLTRLRSRLPVDTAEVTKCLGRIKAYNNIIEDIEHPIQVFDRNIQELEAKIAEFPLEYLQAKPADPLLMKTRAEVAEMRGKRLAYQNMLAESQTYFENINAQMHMNGHNEIQDHPPRITESKVVTMAKSAWGKVKSWFGKK